MITTNHRVWRKSPLPIPLNHFVVLFFLENNGATIISEIAQNLAISKQQMSPIIDKLVKKEFIEKKCMAKDKRFIQIRLSRKGKAFLENHRQEQKQRISEQMKKLTKEDAQVFATSAKIVKKSIETMFK